MSDTILAPLPIEIEPWKTRAARIGLDNDQWIYRFPNGYGASVVCGPYTYGGEAGKYELGVIVFSGDEFQLTYSTPVTDDVLGWLDIDDVAAKLAAIARLPADPSAYSREARDREEGRRRGERLELEP